MQFGPGQGQLDREDRLLHVARREIVVVVQADLADAARAECRGMRARGLGRRLGPAREVPGTVGMHARREPDGAPSRLHAAAFGACGVGEIGLDYHYDFAPRDVQQAVFAVQLSLALAERLPVIIHTRDATDDTFAILKEAGDVQGVFHCFTGDTAMARRALDIGFYLSYAGIITFPKASDLRATVKMVPFDRLLMETDSPYLAPAPHRGKRNEPAYVGKVLESLAAMHGVPLADLDAHVMRNFVRLFGPTRVTATA